MPFFCSTTFCLIFRYIYPHYIYSRFLFSIHFSRTFALALAFTYDSRSICPRRLSPTTPRLSPRSTTLPLNSHDIYMPSPHSATLLPTRSRPPLHAHDIRHTNHSHPLLYDTRYDSRPQPLRDTLAAPRNSFIQIPSLDSTILPPTCAHIVPLRHTTLRDTQTLAYYSATLTTTRTSQITPRHSL